MFKKKWILLFLSFFILGCNFKDSTPKVTVIPDWVDSRMVEWLKNNSSEGWKHVKWDKNLLANLSQGTTESTNKESKKRLDIINEAFMKKKSSNTDPNKGDYVDKGVLVHGYDIWYDSVNTLFKPSKNYMATSYVQSDITKENTRPIWNNTFQDPKYEDVGKPSAGVIYFPIAYITSSPYSIFSIYATDGWSGDKYLGTNSKIEHIQSGTAKDYKEEIQKAWDNNSTISICEKEGVFNYSDYLNYINSHNPPVPPALSSDKKGFDSFSEYHKKLFKEGLAPWNEFIMRLPEDSYENSVAGIFYLNSSNDNYYKAPSEGIKQYNIHLREAQNQQKKLFEEKMKFIPIFEIDMDKLVTGEKPFNYYPEDQVVNIGF